MFPPEGLNTAQQIVALDTRYNSHRPLPNQHRMFVQVPKGGAPSLNSFDVVYSMFLISELVPPPPLFLPTRNLVCVCVYVAKLTDVAASSVMDNAARH